MSKDRIIEEPDEELVRRSIAGDRAAFPEIYRRYVRRVWLLVMKMVPKSQDQEDLTQQVFLLVYRNLAQFRGHSSLFTWIYRITLNTCLHYRRTERRRSQIALLADLPQRALGDLLSAEALSPDRTFERRALISRTLGALPYLPRSQRTVMVLGPIQGRSYQQIAQALGISEDMVKGRLARGRANLRRLVAGPTGEIALAA